LFKQWKMEYIEQFFFQLQIKVYPRNYTLFNEHKESHDIYIIKKGEIEVIFSFTFHFLYFYRYLLIP